SRGRIRAANRSTGKPSRRTERDGRRSRSFGGRRNRLVTFAGAGPRGHVMGRWLAVLCIALGLVASPSSAEAKVRVAFVGAGAGEGFSEKEIQTFEELALSALESTGRFSVLGRSDIVSLIGFERQKQLVGCEGGACVSPDLAGALGVSLVASGAL